MNRARSAFSTFVHDLFRKPVSTFPDHALEYHHASDALALVHQIEALVDVRQWHGVSDHRVDLNFPVHVPVDDPGHVGAAARAAEGCALPHPAGHELEGAGGYFLAGAGDADDHAHAPAAVAAFQRL